MIVFILIERACFSVGKQGSRGFPGGSGGKGSVCNMGGPGRLEKSPGEGNGNTVK